MTYNSPDHLEKVFIETIEKVKHAAMARFIENANSESFISQDANHILDTISKCNDHIERLKKNG